MEPLESLYSAAHSPFAQSTTSGEPVSYKLDMACTLHAISKTTIRLLTTASTTSSNNTDDYPGEITTILLTADKDVCCSLLENVPAAMTSLSAPISLGFARAFCLIWSETQDWKVKSAALAAFFDFADRFSQTTDCTADETIQKALAGLCHISHLATPQSPSVLEGTLSLWGFAVDARLRLDGQWSNALITTVLAWLHLVQNALGEYSVSSNVGHKTTLILTLPRNTRYDMLLLSRYTD